MTEVSKIVIPELDNAAIRRRQNGDCSVYDLIAVVGQQRNPRKTWNRMTERYPEVVAKCYNFKFSGRGQRETPVTDKEGWAYILGILPGIVGHKYRESTANLVTRYLEGDITMAAEVVDRNDNQEDLEWLEARLRGKIARKKFTARLKARGVRDGGYGRCTNQTYLGLLGGTKDQLKKKMSLGKNDNLRDNLSVTKLNSRSFTEDLTGKKVVKNQDYGNDECADTCYYVAKRVADFAADVLSA